MEPKEPRNNENPSEGNAGGGRRIKQRELLLPKGSPQIYPEIKNEEQKAQIERDKQERESDLVRVWTKGNNIPWGLI